MLPLAVNNALVVDSLLVLSSVQVTDRQWQYMRYTYLTIRQRAYKATQCLLNSVSNRENLPAKSHLGLPDEINFLAILANASMFLLHDKITGEITWTAHFNIIARLCQNFSQCLPISSMEASTAFQFLRHLYLYNDLVRATSLQTTTTSDFYVAAASNDFKSRYYFPSLIARICAGDGSVSEADFDGWDGNMSWIPSMSMSSAETMLSAVDATLLIAVYRAAGVAYLHSQNLHWRMSSSVSKAVQLANHIPVSSPLATALLWPLSLAARGLGADRPLERAAVLDRLERMATIVGMNHSQRLKASLIKEWSTSCWATKSLTNMRVGHDRGMMLLG